MTFWCGSGSGFFFFRHWPSRRQQKTNLKNSFSAYYFFKVRYPTFISFFKDKKSKRSHKTVGIKVFFTFLLDDRRIRIRIQEAQKHKDPTDPDPQHMYVCMYGKTVKSVKKRDLKANMCSGTCAGSSQLMSACVTAVCGGILHTNIHSIITK